MEISKNTKDCVLFRIFAEKVLSRLSGSFSKLLQNAGTFFKIFQDAGKCSKMQENFPRCREVLQNFPCRVPDFYMFHQKFACILFLCCSTRKLKFLDLIQGLPCRIPKGCLSALERQNVSVVSKTNLRRKTVSEIYFLYIIGNKRSLSLSTLERSNFFKANKTF